MKYKGMNRTFELLKLATRVGIKELQSGDLNSRIEQAVLIAKSLSKLKGAAMKVGQLLSLDLDNYFPSEAIEILSQLQNAATARPFEEIERVGSQKYTARWLCSRLHEGNCEQYGVSKVKLDRLREVAHG